MAGTDAADGTVATTAEASETARPVVPGNGGPRSAGTRQAIIDAARSAFAMHGYDRTTIRSVASAAGVDASMVMRYFGSKAGLFTAAATADLQIPDLTAIASADRGEALVRHLIGRWEDPSSGEGLMSLLRTAATSDEVASQLQAVLGQLITGPIAATGAADATERGAFIQTQMLGVALCRYVLRQEPLASLPIAQVIATVAPSVQRYLDAPDPAVSQA
jgi:AcrR family transcriptional regulator